MDIDAMQRRVARERAARKQAEALLEQKSLELYEANQRLKASHDDLERRVEQRTQELATANEHLRDVTREAVAASRAKSDFLANMSHEIRTPMNGILGALQILRQRDCTDREEFARTAYESARLLLAILDDILDLSKIEAGRLTLRREPVSLPEIARQVQELFRANAASKGIGLDLRVDGRVPEPLNADPTRVRQILANLVGNAVKFTSAGRVEISLDVRSMGEDRVGLEVSVTDTGPGIPKDRLDRVFSKFTQADDDTGHRFGGTGLGLAIARKLVRLMDGEIGVTSEVGAGSRFWFRLDLARAAPRAEDADETPSHVDLEGTRVLLVEDNLVNRRIATHVLKGLGCVVEEAVDGAAAIDALRERSFHVVLMDCQMPRLDGYEATRRVRAGADGVRDTTVPIVAMTANAMTGDRERCLAAGMDDFVSKPFEVGDLVATLRKRARPATSAADPRS